MAKLNYLNGKISSVAPPRGTWIKDWEDREEKKRPAPGRIQTHNPSETNLYFYRCATTAAQQGEDEKITVVIHQLNDGGDLDAAGLVRVGGRLLLNLDQGSGEEQDVRNDVSSDHVAVDELAIESLERDFL